jgi:uncharacterized membrane protein YccC
MLIVKTQPTWIAAIHRFVEVSVGIVIGLAISAVWPQQEEGGATPAPGASS